MATLSPTERRERDSHDWTSSEYVSQWAEGQDKKEDLRQEPFRVMAQTIPFDKGLPISLGLPLAGSPRSGTLIRVKTS